MPSLKSLRDRSILLIFALAASASGSAEPRVERNAVYGMYSGLALTMDVYHPAQPNGYGVVFISGSGWTRELSLDATPLTRTGQEKVYAIPLAEAGYTVFNINHRAAPRFRYPAPLKDVQRAVRFIRHHAQDYAIDPDRIGAMGGSSGAHLVSMLGVMDGAGDKDDPSLINQESAKVQAVVTRAAPMDLRNDPGAPLFGFRDNVSRIGKVELNQLKQASPITYVSPDDPPFLLIHGDKDPVVPFQRSVDMHKALTKAGVTAELIPVVGGGHGPRYEAMVMVDGKRVRREPQNPPDYIAAMIAWFDQHLMVD